jgi:YihY family inner membrane protein
MFAQKWSSFFRRKKPDRKRASDSMMNRRRYRFWLKENLWRFLLRVLRSFNKNQGFLLAGAVSYYTLLSIVPLSILAPIVLAQFIDEHQLIQTLSTYLGMMIPGYADTLIGQVQTFLDHRHVVGIIGFIGMLFFSSLAFTMLEKAMFVIFVRPDTIYRRYFLVSAILPYVYIVVMGIGMALASFVVGAVEKLETRRLSLFNWHLDLGGTTGVALYLLGIIGEVLMLTSIYLVMPVVRVRIRYALIGGITAAILWEITRRVLIWYYAAISIVNVIYGSIATTVVALLSIEVVTIILLLGAQVIAELERSHDKPADDKHAGFGL